jgi:hypothetical protein
VPQLYAATDNGAATPGTVLYLLPHDIESSPSSIAFADSWSSYSGTYIFLEAALGSGTEAAFAASAWSFLADPRIPGARFAWMSWPDTSEPVTGTAIPIASGALSFSVTFAFQNVSLVMSAGVTVAIDTANIAFDFTQSGNHSIFLTARSGSVQIDGVGSTLIVPLQNALAGTLQFPLTLASADLDSLDAGLRFFYATPWGSDDTNDGGDIFLSSLRYPVISEAQITVYAALDPLAPLTNSRTFFAFNAADAGQTGSTPTAFSSYYNSTLGDSFSLLPLTGSAAPTHFAALVFSPNPQSDPPGAGDPYTIVPYGDFQLQTSRLTATSFMGGISGVESFALDAQNSGILSFFPGQNAFAQGFVPGKGPSQPVTLSSPVTTSWAFVSGTSGATIDYYAQPDQAVLFQPDSGTPLTIGQLVPMSIVTATLTAPAVTSAFPLLPYSGVVADDFSPYLQMESQIVSPMRRAQLASSPANFPASGTDDDTTVTGTTPQGLVGTFSSDLSQWLSVALVQTTSTLQLTNVTGDLRSALQTNKLFLVISEASTFSNYLTSGNSIVDLEDWQFNLDPSSTWGTGTGTIMIFKFLPLPLAQLAAQTSTWAYASSFNVDPGATSANITAIINAAKTAQEGGDPDYDTFLAIVNDASWNGVLILNANLALMPSSLTGLMAGIDPTQLYGHHLGVNVSTVQQSKGAIQIATSSIFGLIDYNSGPLKNDGAPYNFKVEQLKVLFIGSAIADFTSLVDLQINQLLGENGTLQGAGDNIVQLRGIYQTHVATNGQTDSTYVFSTVQTSIYDMSSAVLNAVQLTSGQFITVGMVDNVTTSKFVFWSIIDFEQLPFDIFSFGRTSGTAPVGLSVGNLAIVMTQAGSDALTFAFDASQLSIDMAGSTWRTASLYAHFPLTVAGITQGSGADTPQSLGFMSVQTPLTQSTVKVPWFSLNYNLNLGSPGALAAQVGFVATLTAAWEPNDTGNYTIYTGLQLPGSNGSKRQISIQGIFDITFKTLEIVVPASSPTSFILVLYNIGFSFLSFTFPPTGQVNFVLFGDPTSGGGGGGNLSTSLGWYVAYAKPKTNSNPTNTQQAGLTGQRAEVRRERRALEAWKGR